MTSEQEKATKSLERALKKVRDADLKLLVLTGSVYVCPIEINTQENGGADCFEILERHGAECTPNGLWADGGAGN